MRTSGPAPRSALLRRAPSTPVASPQSATFRLKAGATPVRGGGGPAPCPSRRGFIPDPAPSEGRPSASKCAYGSFVANSPPKRGTGLAHSRFPSGKRHMFRSRPSGRTARPALDRRGRGRLSPYMTSEIPISRGSGRIPRQMTCGKRPLPTPCEEGALLMPVRGGNGARFRRKCIADHALPLLDEVA